jgi:hypothetical protein
MHEDDYDILGIEDDTVALSMTEISGLALEKIREILEKEEYSEKHDLERIDFYLERTFYT